MKRTLFNQTGNSLIQVMVAAGLMGILALIFTSMIADQNKQVKALSEKMQTQEVARSITALLSDPNYCSCLFRGQTFDTISNTWSAGLTDIPVSFTAVPATGLCTASTTKIAGVVGSKLSGSTMIIKSLGLSDVNLITPGTGNYSAKVEIALDDSIRAMKNITSSYNFTVNTSTGSTTARPFVYCGSPAGGGCRFCRDTCGGPWPIPGGMPDTKDADWSGLGIRCRLYWDDTVS